jgi:hypothetical protein
MPNKGEVKVSLDGMIDATDGASSESAFTEVVRWAADCPEESGGRSRSILQLACGKV